MSKLKVLDLFSGIGGFSLGLERTGGFETIAFCEIDNYAQRVLHKHWPKVFIHSDIRKLGRQHFEGWKQPDVITGGFPCQDISKAGKGAGLSGERSGLWTEMWRLIRELRPRYVVAENVPTLLGRGLDTVLGNLAESGYDAEWDCIPAAAIGAPHLRDRIWIVAYPNADSERFDAGREALQELHPRKSEQGCKSCQLRPDVSAPTQSDWWGTEPGVGRLVTGISNRVDRVASLGNSIVPQIATWIGERILTYEQAQRD